MALDAALLERKLAGAALGAAAEVVGGAAVGLATREIHLKVPWHPEREVQRLEIIAKDADGLTSRYVADL